ncbi:hypothetical protein ABPG72_007367 [Tetrahymena utriculariae]
MNTVLPVQSKTKKYDEVQSLDTESQNNSKDANLKTLKNQKKNWSKKKNIHALLFLQLQFFAQLELLHFVLFILRIIRELKEEQSGQALQKLTANKQNIIKLILIQLSRILVNQKLLCSLHNKKKNIDQQQNQENQGQAKEVEQTCYTAKIEGQDQSYRFCNQQSKEDPNKFYYETFFSAVDLIKQLNQLNKQDSDTRNLQKQDDEGDSQFTIYEEDGIVKIFNQQIHDLNNQLSSQDLQFEYQYLQEADIKNQQETVYNNNQSRVFSVQAQNLQNPYQPYYNSNDKSTIDSKNKRVLDFWSSVCDHVTSEVKTSGGIIGAVVGGIAGGIIDFPKGIIAGAQIGYDIGSYAQAAAKTCLPQDSKGNVSFHCDINQGIEEGFQIVGGNIIKQNIPKGFLGHVFTKIAFLRRK